QFLLAPYYLSNDTLPWKINGTIYMMLTVSLFAISLAFAFRISDRKTFWFLNLIVLLSVSDFAIRYQDAFVDTHTFSWAESVWSSALVGFAWLIHYLKK